MELSTELFCFFVFVFGQTYPLSLPLSPHFHPRTPLSFFSSPKLSLSNSLFETLFLSAFFLTHQTPSSQTLFIFSGLAGPGSPPTAASRAPQSTVNAVVVVAAVVVVVVVVIIIVVDVVDFVAVGVGGKLGADWLT